MGDLSQLNELRGCEAFSGHIIPAKYIIIPNHLISYMAQYTNFATDVESLQQIKIMLCNYSIVGSGTGKISPTYIAITSHI
jgi:hypothetical protein